MNAEQIQRDMAFVTAKQGRRFTNDVDLSFEGVNKWRRSVGLPELTLEQYKELR